MTAPRLASTLALVRDAADGIDVLLMRRHSRSAFMADAWVFPGGAVDDADHDHGWREHLRGAEALDDVARASVVAALRECVEEAGLWLADRDGVPLVLGDEGGDFEALRTAVDTGARLLLDVARAEQLSFDASALTMFAHWVTPPFESRRFDTRFFAARAPAAQLARHDGRELTDMAWMAPSAALAAYAAGEIVLAPPTWCVLNDLAQLADVDAVLAWAAQTRPQPIEPTLIERDGSPALLLPGFIGAGSAPTGVPCLLLDAPYRFADEG